MGTQGDKKAKTMANIYIYLKIIKWLMPEEKEDQSPSGKSETVTFLGGQAREGGSVMKRGHKGGVSTQQVETES